MNHVEMNKILGHRVGLQLTSPLPRAGVVEKANGFIDDWVHDGGRKIGLGKNPLDEAQDTMQIIKFEILFKKS